MSRSESDVLRDIRTLLKGASEEDGTVSALALTGLTEQLQPLEAELVALKIVKLKETKRCYEAHVELKDMLARYEPVEVKPVDLDQVLEYASRLGKYTSAPKAFDPSRPQVGRPDGSCSMLD